MSSDQITYVLVALVVTGVAILLLLAGALLARRGRTAAGAAVPAAGPDLATSAPPPAAPAPALLQATPWPAPAPLPVAPPPQTVPEVVAPLPFATAPVPERPAPPDEGHGPEETGVTSADLEAAAQRVHDPRDQEVIEGFLSISPRRRETAAFDASPQPSVSAPVGAAVGVAIAAEVVPSDPYVDDVTGLDSRAAWDRAVSEENARYVRYRRPVGVVVAELDGLGRFEREFGTEATQRILTAVGGAMRRGARRTDRVAHVGRRALPRAAARDRRDPGDQLRGARPRGVRALAQGRRGGPPRCHGLGEPQRRRRAGHRRADGRGADVRRAAPRCPRRSRGLRRISLTGALVGRRVPRRPAAPSSGFLRAPR